MYALDRTAHRSSKMKKSLDMAENMPTIRLANGQASAVRPHSHQAFSCKGTVLVHREGLSRVRLFCFPEPLFGSAKAMRPVRPADKKTGALTDKTARRTSLGYYRNRGNRLIQASRLHAAVPLENEQAAYGTGSFLRKELQGMAVKGASTLCPVLWEQGIHNGGQS